MEERSVLSAEDFDHPGIDADERIRTANHDELARRLLEWLNKHFNLQNYCTDEWRAGTVVAEGSHEGIDDVAIAWLRERGNVERAQIFVLLFINGYWSYGGKISLAVVQNLCGMLKDCNPLSFLYPIIIGLLSEVILSQRRGLSGSDERITLARAAIVSQVQTIQSISKYQRLNKEVVCVLRKYPAQQ